MNLKYKLKGSINTTWLNFLVKKIFSILSLISRLNLIIFTFASAI